MAAMVTVTRVVPAVSATVPPQGSIEVKTRTGDAFASARRLGDALGGFVSIAMNVEELQKADGKYVIVVASAGMPQSAGRYEVVRNTAEDTIKFMPITREQAKSLMKAGRRYDVLYVDKTATDAAKEGDPVALSAYYYFGRRGLLANSWPSSQVHVAVSVQTQTIHDAYTANALYDALTNLERNPHVGAEDLYSLRQLVHDAIGRKD